LKRTFFNLRDFRERRADVGAVACITLFFIASFPQGLFGGKYLLVNDAFFYSFPLRKVAWDMIRAGVLPLWTPNLLSGYPLLSMAQIGLGYPLTWGYLFLPGHVAEQIYVLAPFLLAPIFTYAYLRVLQRSPLASLLGALTFGYGGMMASPLANNGLFPNAVMWLPLLLIGIERARQRSFIRALLLSTFAYAMSVLTGLGQGFVYIGTIAAAYAFFLLLFGASPHDKVRQRLASLDSWRPVFAVAGAGLLAMGLAAFQILETARVVRRSIRSTISYESFTEGSFTPGLLWRSFTTPLFYVIDMHASVVPFAAVLAVVAIWSHLTRREGRDLRLFFWSVVAVLGCWLMLGSSTPLYHVVYYLPILNRFRVPSRHTFEWTFAIGILAAYGWDVLVPIFQSYRERIARSRWTTIYTAIALLALSVVVGAIWWRKSQTLAIGTLGLFDGATVYNLLKGAFALLSVGALWRAALISSLRWRAGLLCAALLVLCFVEPSLLINRWWGRMGLPASRFTTPSEATKYLQQFPPSEHRVYTRVDLMSEQFGVPRFDAANISAIWNLQNVAGYEPLILERYSNALGGAWLDAVHTLATGNPDGSLVSTRSHVLDLLNTNFIVSYPNLATSLSSAGEPGNAKDIKIIGELPPGAKKTLVVQPTTADSLVMVTSLSNSTAVAEGETIALLRLYAADGKTFDRELRAGRDTAEWAHERPDVHQDIKHKLAPVFDTMQVGGENGFLAYRFKATFRLEGQPTVTRIDLVNVSPLARLGIYGAMLVDSSTSRSVTLSSPYVALSSPYSEEWEPVYEKNQTLILRNKRALPRAWLVGEAESVRGEIALARIRGESDRPFDPRRTALLEVQPNELPALPGGELASGSTANITAYESNRLSIETDAPTATVLVVSEIFYPGWEATLDGKPARILLTDYLLRGIALPPGQHRIEMRYTAPAARNGAIISVVTLLVLITLAIYARRQRPVPPRG
jgi:hypothetical protein